MGASMLSRLYRLSVIGALVAAAFAGAFGFYLSQWEKSKITLDKEVIFEFKGGMGLGALAQKLANEGVVDHATLFNLAVRLSGDYKRYQAGTYRFAGQVAPVDVETALFSGQTYNPVVAQITIPEGFRLKEVSERLAAHGIGHIVEIVNLVKDKSFLNELNVPSVSLEGYVYPATYSFYRLPTAREALSTMVKKFWQNLPANYQDQVSGKGLSLNEAVIFASLIELETMHDEERPLVSEVIWRRLKDKVPLGIDAALIYGIKDYQGDLTWAHLADRKNPYNTRIHIGLPPTAIGSPSRKSLEAVLAPSNLGYYYYVLVPGQNHHHFSKTLAEHNLHVKKLVNGTKRERAHEKGGR